MFLQNRPTTQNEAGLIKVSTVMLASIAVLVVVGYLSSATSAEAATFDKNRVISDADMTDWQRMSAAKVQEFLSSQGGALGDYREDDIDGVNRSAAEILYNTAYKYRLNPQFLITRLQVEASLVQGHRTELIPWAMGFGLCDSCSKSDPNIIANYKGFSKQMDLAGNQIRNNYIARLDSVGNYNGWGVGITKNSLDGVAITPQNKATAVLYTYTPWVGYHGGDASVGGNSLYFDIINKYFPNRTSKVIDYPNGSLFQDVDSGAVFKLEKDKLRPIVSASALYSNYDLSRIISVDSAVLDRYEEGNSITRPKFVYLQAPTGGVYLIDGSHNRRAITSRETLRQLGVNPEELIPASQEEIDSIPEKPPITSSEYPAGALLQNKETGAVQYFDTNSDLHPVYTKDILDNKYKGYTIVPEEPEFFDDHEVKAPAKLTSGSLIKYEHRDTIYMISEKGKKREVNNKKVLKALGGNKSVQVITDKKTLKLHPTGKKKVKFEETNQ